MEIKKLAVAALAATLMLWSGASAAGYQDGVYRDVGEGYNDTVVVTLTVRGGKLETFDAQNKSGAEPSEYMQQAIEGMRAQILDKQGIDGVDAVSGATGSSQSILDAMKGVLLQASVQSTAGNAAGGEATGNAAGVQTDSPPQTAATPRPTADASKANVFSGLGSVANFRVGPGKDDTGAQVYSFNVAMANAIFDRDGRILHVRVDVYEVSTPNYDGDSMPHFSGWPGKEGYNVYDSAKAKVSSVSEQTDESTAEELAGWVTKRERGDAYGMNPQNDWYKQMNAYEQWMIGQTTAELCEWYGKYASARNGRPIKVTSEDADDQKALSGMSDAERQALTDLTSMATMSLSDGHGLLLEAIEKAYENRTPVEGVN